MQFLIAFLTAFYLKKVFNKDLFILEWFNFEFYFSGFVYNFRNKILKADTTHKLVLQYFSHCLKLLFTVTVTYAL